MNTTTDKQQARKDEVVKCVWRVILRDGADKVSIRAIADELGGTTGFITHYFRNKDALMQIALEQVMEQIWRVNLSEIKKGIKSRDIIDEWLTILPTNQERMDHWRVWASYTGYAASRPVLLDQYCKHHGRQIEIISGNFRRYEEIGAITLNVSPEAESAAFLALLRGLGMGWVIDPSRYPQSILREALEANYGARLKDT